MKKTLVLLALAAPTPLLSQSRTLLSPYLASDGTVRGSPVMLGANVSRETGWVAVRAGGAVDAHTLLGPSGSTAPYGAVYAADADGLLFAGSPTGDGPVPYAVVGVGVRTVRAGSATETAGSYSYGAGVRTPLTPWLSLEGEARYSEPIAAGMVAGDLGAGWAVRFGASVRVSGAGRRRPAAPVPVSLPRAPSGAGGAPAAARAAVAQRALDTADDYVGTPYLWGGDTPDGFDCSGFVRFVFARQGIDLPRVSRDQARSGEALPLDVGALEAGDLIAFASRRGGEVDHIAIYAGGNRIIHSSASGHGVRFDDLGSRRGAWYVGHMVAARRVIGVPLYLAAQEE